MMRKRALNRISRPVGFLGVLLGVSVFCVFQYCVALLRLTDQSSGMANKFSALARDKYMDFLILENLYVLLAYLILGVCFAFVLQPFACLLCAKYRFFQGWKRFLPGVIGAFLIHGYFTLRLVETRPYFLDDAKFGYWYYEILNVVPDVAKPVVFGLLFSVLPVAILGYVLVWHWRGWTGARRLIAGAAVLGLSGLIVWKAGLFGGTARGKEMADDGERMNVIVIGSDSLRGDKLGYSGYVPRRKDGLAAGGVSPVIDELAGRSIVLENCYTPIASTLESGTSMMASQYPHKHGFRHMYPNKERVLQTQAETEPIAGVLAQKGYDTAVFGDWCAGYFELMPLGFENVSVSSFDNFKIYMSQAVMMAHFVVPLYFDHPVGYAIFPQLGSFAQFVTPDVVTERVEKRLGNVSKKGKPFFWHVFYSCNHLPYRNPEPYSSMFTDPNYMGPNRNGVDFDIDSFIGGTDLENKWNVLPKKEIQQIRDLYDGCTRQFDDNVGKILAALEKNGLAENTIIVITADHGDNLYEEGVTLGHGLTFNGELHANHVPLVFHVPGMETRRVNEIVRTIDIAPTITKLLDVEQPASWQGRSVAGWIDGSEVPEDRAFYGETGFPFIQFRVNGVERPKLPPMDQMTEIVESFNYQFVLKEEFEGPLVAAKQRCLMTKDWKLICTPSADGGRHFDLFSYAGDGYEKVEPSAGNDAEFSSLRKALESWMDEGIETPAAGIFSGI
ncbi:sulfatase [Luteolibacter sp. AS25]|uniref:sulfatase family protein n=1 Tax=Luteolibacter sp. AS25 TaxID=3135776 RepID=UPI00398ACABC